MFQEYNQININHQINYKMSLQNKTDMNHQLCKKVKRQNLNHQRTINH